jgi:hypothetical protein
MPNFFVGLDLGQVSEPSAVAIVEKRRTPGKDEINCFSVRHLERFPAGTPFPSIASTLATMFRSEKLNGGTLIVDITAAGQPVLRLLKRAEIKAQIVPVYLTSGHKSTFESGCWLVPKIELISTIQVLLQERRLKVAESLPDSNTLVRELTNFRMKVALASADQLPAWREGAFDDLVFAVGMATWQVERCRQFRIWT